MNVLKKVARVLVSEGFPGILKRLYYRIYLMKLKVLEKFDVRSVRSRYGPVFRANYKDATFKLYIAGAYGKFYWNELQSINHPFVFLDIGANQGLYTLGAALNPYLQKAYSFEPVPETAKFLRTNLELNGKSDIVSVIEKAISNVSGAVEIYRDEKHSGGATIASSNQNIQRFNSEKIQTISHIELDQLIPDDDLPIYVKIDVEGHELVVLSEIFKTKFSSRIVQVFHEVDEKWINPSEAEALLKANGFTSSKVGVGSHYDVLARRSC